MKEFLFKKADDRIKKVVDLIQSTIKLTKFEGKVNLTGGCIRDLILGREVKDLDIVVEMESGGMLFATFFAIKNSCYAEGKNPVIYVNSGAAKVQLYNNEELKDIVIECVESKSKVAQKDDLFGYQFSRDEYGLLTQDAKTRDLTINAMYYNITTEQLQDYNGTAVDDMVSQTLRTPGDPYLTFSKDPIKMMRVIRFATTLGWDIEKHTWLAMIENAKNITKAPQESISNELVKILTAKQPSRGILKMYLCGLLDKIMPDIYDTTKAYESRNPVVTTFEHTLKMLDMVQPYIEHRLAVLFHDVGKVVTDFDRTVSPDQFSAEIAAHELKRMKFPNKIIRSVETAIRYHRVFKLYKSGSKVPDRKIRKFMSLCGDDLSPTIDLMNANNNCCTYDKNPTQVIEVLTRIEELEQEEELSNVKLPINGNDIIKEFRVKGPIIGIALEAVKEAYFDNPNITKDECLDIVEKKIKTYAV